MATKEDLEAAVIKSIVHAPLTIDEVLALYEAESSELLEEFELTSGQLTKVNFWLQQQAQRLIAQEQLQGNRKLEEKKKIKGLSKNHLKRIILEAVDEYVGYDGPALPSLVIAIGPNGTPVITHPEANMDLEIVDYDSAEDLLFDIQTDLGPYRADEIVVDEEGILGGDMSIPRAFETIMTMSG